LHVYEIITGHLVSNIIFGARPLIAVICGEKDGSTGA